MITPDQEILTTLTKEFLNVVKMGSRNILPDAKSLLYLLITIDLAWAAICWSLSEAANLKHEEFVKKIVFYGAFIFMVTEYQTIVNAIMESFLKVGLKAGGNTLTITDITNPSTISKMGMDIVAPMFDNLNVGGSVVNGLLSGLSGAEGGGILQPLLKAAVLGILGFLIILCYFFIGIQIFITYLEFMIIAAIGLILIPFGAWGPTNFIFDKIKNSIINLGIKFMVLAFVASISIYVAREWTIPADPTWQQVMYILLGSAAIAFLNWHVPATASGISSGSGGAGFGMGMATGAAMGSIGAGTRVASTPTTAASNAMKGLTNAVFGTPTKNSATNAMVRTGGLFGQGGIMNKSNVTGSESTPNYDIAPASSAPPPAKPLADGQKANTGSGNTGYQPQNSQNSNNPTGTTPEGSSTSGAPTDSSNSSISGQDTGVHAPETNTNINSPSSNVNDSSHSANITNNPDSHTQGTGADKSTGSNSTSTQSNGSVSSGSSTSPPTGTTDRSTGTFDTGANHAPSPGTGSHSSSSGFVNNPSATTAPPRSFGTETQQPSLNIDRSADIKAATKTDHTRGINQ